MAAPKRAWRAADVNLVKGVLKERRAEDQRRADAWRATREAELEAVVGRAYDGLDIPEIAALIAEVEAVFAPYQAKFDQLFTAHYPAKFAKASLGFYIKPGGIHPKDREQVRRDATRHILARHRVMLANIAGNSTEVVADVSMRATDNPEVRDMLGRVAVPNATTPHLESPGPAIGMLEKLLPHPEEWGFDGAYEAKGSPILPSPAMPKALPDPSRKT